MTATIIPNAFQSPNSYVDVSMELLSGEEYKCLSFAARHILGWQDKINAREGVISLSMFEHGYADASGTRYGGTGVNRATLIAALEQLVTYGLLIKIGDPTPDGQRWQLGASPDWDGLTKRRDAQVETQRARTAKATAAKQAKREAGGTSDVPVRGTNQSQYVGRTDAGTSDVLNQSHIKTNQNQRDEDAERPNIFRLYEQMFGGITPTAADDLKDAAQEYPADWIKDAFDLTRQRRGRSWKYTLAILENWRRFGRDEKQQLPAKAAATEPDDVVTLDPATQDMFARAFQTKKEATDATT